MSIINENGYRPTIISETPEPVNGALYAKFILAQLEEEQQ
jgi:hypothetical protein